MANCSCGAVDHMDQVDFYPVGTKVLLSKYGNAIVTGHCQDGRAVFEGSNAGYTFHNTNGWVLSVKYPQEDYLWTDDRLRQTCGYYSDSELTMCLDDVVAMRDEYESAIAELRN